MNSLYNWDEKFFDRLDMRTYDKQDSSDTDKRCLQNSLKQFLNTGKKDDAFSVYFCFCEIFKLFGSGYDNTKKLLELLSDHEYHSGELLSKHRDHYSHSIYVFSLGLAIFANDETFRNSYLKFYNLDDNGTSYFNFLKFWGMVALFHDVGYPFQLAHEQIKTYTSEMWNNEKNVPVVTYCNFDAFITLDERTRTKLNNIFKDARPFETYHDLLAYGLKIREGYDEAEVIHKLKTRIMDRPRFMDHGYFSAMILARQLFSLTEYSFSMQYLDVLTGILLHNNFNKFDAPNKHPIHLNEHPLSYLLILCDELQCWDRLPYGKISKQDPVAWEFALDISNNKLTACYTYDSYFQENEKHSLNKNYQEMKNGEFKNNILSYIHSSLDLTIITNEKKKDKRVTLFASDDNFVNLCDIAKSIHASYLDHCIALDVDSISKSFGDLDLEFKLSNIEQAKSYSHKLELVNCFYSSKQLDYPIVHDFKDVECDFNDALDYLCREEHVRWVKEKLAMGWKYGTDYANVEERNKKMIHKDIVPYEMLTEDEKSKDKLMVNNILTLLKKYDSNIKIYNYRIGRKPTLEIAGTGHRFFNDNYDDIKKKVKNFLIDQSKYNHVVVRTCFANGADQLIAECAIELGLTLKAVLPLPLEEYIQNIKKDASLHKKPFDELKVRHLLAQTVVCKIIEDKDFIYAEANKYMVRKCDILLAIWDGVQTPLEDSKGMPINRGGTYDCIRLARKLEKKIEIIDCYR